LNLCHSFGAVYKWCLSFLFILGVVVRNCSRRRLLVDVDYIIARYGPVSECIQVA